jgi:NitT/TauT family transport system permease protein
MTTNANLKNQEARPDYEIAHGSFTDLGDVSQPLPLLTRVTNQLWLRRVSVLLLFCLAWELYARYLDNPLLLPSFSSTMSALLASITNGELPERALVSLKVLLLGYATGVACAALLTGFAISSRFGADVLSTFTAMFNPLPALAVLPLALLWFGLGSGSLIFVMVHSVLWACALSTFTGFLSVSATLKMAGRNMGLRGVRYIALLLAPAAFPFILSGLKLGWAFAWRTLIGAEMIFGVTSGSGGLGWYIFENRSLLETENVFAGLLMVIIIGLVVEAVVFRTIEKMTIKRWGMQNG